MESEFPTSIEVIIEGADNESKAKLLRTVPFTVNASAKKLGLSPVAEYETDDGQRFCIDQEYIQNCAKSGKPPHIPLQVINKNQETRDKMQQYYELEAKKQKEQETGLVLPEGFRV